MMLSNPGHASIQRIQTPLLLFFFFLSGSAGLAYEILWIRQLSLIFGNTTFAVSTVLTVFMGGLALGSAVIGRLADRVSRPLLIYAGLEIILGLYALIAPFLFDQLIPVSRWISPFFQNVTGLAVLRFLFAAAVLIVPASLMGGTLPVLARAMSHTSGDLPLRAGLLYTVNTAGAVAGTLLTGFWLLPRLGMARSTQVIVTVNILIGLLIIGRECFRRREPARQSTPALSESENPAPLTPVQKAALLALAVAGFCSMIYEVAWTRVLTLILGSSTYAFTIMLAAFLTGITLGSGISTRRLRSARRPGTGMLAALHALMGILALATSYLFQHLPHFYARLFHQTADVSQTAFWISNLLIAFLIMLPAATASGALFPAALNTLRPARPGAGIGQGYAANTLGAITGSFLAGWVLIPFLGILNAMLIGIVVNIGFSLSLRLYAVHRRTVRALMILGSGLFALGCFTLLKPAWNRMLMSSGIYYYASSMKNVSAQALNASANDNREILYYKEGVSSTVMVVLEKGTGSTLLIIDGKVDASSIYDMPTQMLIAHIPLMLAPAAQDVLVIGFASGVTTGSVLRYPVRHVTAVEIESAVVEASRFFQHVNRRPLKDRRCRLVIDDARNFLQLTHDRFDVIIAEPPNPWIAGVANLFTRDFFETGRARLAENGIFAQWVQIYNLSTEDLKVILRTFQSVFPHVLLFETIEDADVLLIGSLQPLDLNADAVRQQFSRPELKKDMKRIRIHNEGDLLAHFLMGSETLKAWTGPGLINTDDNAYIQFSTPKTLYTTTRDTNSVLLNAEADCILDFLNMDPFTQLEKRELLGRLALAYGNKTMKRGECVREAMRNQTPQNP